MGFKAFEHLIILFTVYILTFAGHLELHKNGPDDHQMGPETIQMSALYDYEKGTILYKDEVAGVCMVENVGNEESALTNSVIFPGYDEMSYIPMSNLFFEQIINSTIAKAFCGKFPIYEVSSLLHVRSREMSTNHESKHRQKRSVSNGNYNPYPSQYWPQLGPASQTQIQGQVTGQGFFSGQAQSQQTGVSQSQVQLSGTGILGSLSSSAGNAQAQIALGRGDGSGQAASSGVGPSNSQVQVNLGQEGRGSMASASVLAGQGGLSRDHAGYSKSGWVPGSNVPKVIQPGYNGNGGGSQVHSRGPLHNSYGLETGRNIRNGHNQPQPQHNQYNSIVEDDVRQQHHGGYGSGLGPSPQYNGQMARTDQSGRHGIDQLAQIYPPRTSQHGQETYTNGLQSAKLPYPGISFPTGQPALGVDHVVSQPIGNQFIPATSLDQIPSQNLAGLGQQFTPETNNDQLRGTGMNQPAVSENNLDLGYSHQQPGRDIQSLSGTRGQQATNGVTQTHPIASIPHRNVYPQLPSNGQTSTNGGRTYSPQQQIPSYLGGAIVRQPQAFASSHGQAQAQTVYLGPGTTDFYSPGRVSYGSSSYHPNNGAGSVNGGRNQQQYSTYDTNPQGRTTSNGYRVNGYHETTSYSNGPGNGPSKISSPGYIDQSRSTPDGFVQPYATSNGYTTVQQTRQRSTNGYVSPSGEITGSNLGVGHQGQNRVQGLTPTIHTSGTGTTSLRGNGYSDTDQTHGSTLARSSVTNGQGATQHMQPGTESDQHSQISESSHIPRSQVQSPVYTQQPSQNTYPRTISNFLQRPHEQDGFSPSYGISQPNLHDIGSGSQRCTVITFTCTVIIESNGRAKICRPNSNQVNGANVGGGGETAAQNRPTGGGICCC